MSRRVIKLNELEPSMRAVILALIEAQRNACARGYHVMEGDRCKYASAHRKEGDA